MGSWKPSTRGLYQSYHKKFIAFVRKRKLRYFSFQTLLNFAVYLRDKDNLAISTIRSTVGGVKTILGICLPHLFHPGNSSNATLARLLKGMAKNEPKKVPKIGWDISSLMRYLLSWKEVSFRTTRTFERSSQKLIILLMLAAGLRISEVCNLKREAISFSSHPCSMSWGFADSFLRKSEHGLNKFTPFPIPGLHGSDAAANCPVCYTKDFLHKSKDLTSSSVLLFNRASGTPMAPVRASTLVKQAILAADPSAVSPFSHDLRRLAASLVINHRKLEFEVMMARGGWASRSTPIRSYLLLTKSSAPIVALGAAIEGADLEVESE
jgi:integrase